ncbi:MAG: cupin domain-containing protein [Pseudomonadales bacterium]|nr:cupin domain-containing protein [Pseudomonadales bacterium]
MNEKIRSIITQLELEAHPEGGYFKRTYESKDMLDTEHGRRHAMTSIYYLLTRSDFSRFHRINSNERWFHHQGGPLSIYYIDANKRLITLGLGDIASGKTPVVDVPAGAWFAAEIDNGAEYCLVSCVVCPGFDFIDFELADPKSLAKEYPEFSNLIFRLS